MSKFIDVFYLPDLDMQAPYRCFIWQSGDIVDAMEHRSLAAMAQWCKEQDTVVRVYDTKVREELLAYGIDVQPPADRIPARVRQVGED